MEKMNVVIFEENGWWIAQALESDLTAQAREFRDLPEEFFRVVLGHILICEKTGEVPFKSLQKAPQQYWERFEEQGVLRNRVILLLR